MTPPASGTATSARPPVQSEFSWPDGQVVVVGLKLHETTQPYAISAADMKRWVQYEAVGGVNYKWPGEDCLHAGLV